MILQRLLIVPAVLLALLAGCGPKLAPPGPAPGVPELLQTGLGSASFKTADGYHLTLRRWLTEGAPEAVILGLHGFNDHADFIAPAAEVWRRRGIATYAYDQRGFGTSSVRGLWGGAEQYAKDANSALRLLRRRYPDTPLYLLGESMGGAVAIAALTRSDAAEVQGLILSAPGVRGRDSLPLGHRLGLYLASHTLPWVALRPPRTAAIQASDNIEALIALGQDPLVIKRTRMDTVYGLVNLMDLAQARAGQLKQPLLLLYGEKDALIPPEAIERLWTRLPQEAGNRRRALYPEGWHLLFKDLQAAVIIEDVAHWVKAPDAALPSQADLRAPAVDADEPLDAVE